MLPAAKQFLGIKIEKYESQIQKGKEVVTSKSPQRRHCIDQNKTYCTFENIRKYRKC